MHGRSHILPAWIYKYISDERKELFAVDVDEIQYTGFDLSDYQPAVLHFRNGTPYDNNWYCEDCEKQFAKHDEFAAKFLKEPSRLKSRNYRERSVPSIHGALPYKVITCLGAWKWHQFLLSITYRLHCSQHEQYSHIDIGQENADRIRDLILKGTYDKRILEHEFVVGAAVNYQDAASHGFVGDASGGTHDDGGFTVHLCLMGVLVFLGFPHGILDLPFYLLRDTTDDEHFYELPEDESLRWIIRRASSRT